LKEKSIFLLPGGVSSYQLLRRGRKFKKREGGRPFALHVEGRGRRGPFVKGEKISGKGKGEAFLVPVP